MKYSVSNFGLDEFKCPDCGVMAVSANLVFWLDQIRKACGLPLVVNSGYRCAKRNAAVGGAPESRHLIGCAADIAVPRKFVEYGLFVSLVKRFLYEGCEFKEYPNKTYVHIAVPRTEYKNVWRGGELTI